MSWRHPNDADVMAAPAGRQLRSHGRSPHTQTIDDAAQVHADSQIVQQLQLPVHPQHDMNDLHAHMQPASMHTHYPSHVYQQPGYDMDSHQSAVLHHPPIEAPPSSPSPAPKAHDPHCVLPQLTALSTCVVCQCKLYTPPSALVTSVVPSLGMPYQPSHLHSVACLHGRCMTCCSRLTLPCAVHRLPVRPHANVHNSEVISTLKVSGVYKSAAQTTVYKEEQRVAAVSALHASQLMHSSGMIPQTSTPSKLVGGTYDGVISGVTSFGFLVTVIVAGIVHKGLIVSRPCNVSVSALHESSTMQLLERAGLDSQQRQIVNKQGMDEDYATMHGRKRRYQKTGTHKKTNRQAHNQPPPTQAHLQPQTDASNVQQLQQQNAHQSSTMPHAAAPVNAGNQQAPVSAPAAFLAPATAPSRSPSNRAHASPPAKSKAETAQSPPPRRSPRG